MGQKENMGALYDKDFFEWTASTAQQIREGHIADADLEHIAEEIEDIGRRDQRSVESHLNILLIHLLKWRLQPERRYSKSGRSSWLNSILEQRRSLRSIFHQSGSLERHAVRSLLGVYQTSLQQASAQTGLPLAKFPDICPFRFEQIMDDDFLPD